MRMYLSSHCLALANLCSRGLAVVMAEDTGDVAQYNPVPGTWFLLLLWKSN